MSALKACQALVKRVASVEGQVGDVGREALVEPQVVPPAHRHEVAEPHVGQLVEDRLGAAEALGVGRRVAEDLALAEA